MKPSVILVAAIFLAFLNRSIGAEPLILQPGVPLIIAADEPEALQLAAKDLARDLAKVLGKPSPIGTSAAPGATPIIICGPSNRSVPGTFREGLSGTESHTITVRPYGNGRAVVLCGADMRGAIYACYEFSDRFLDIPPLWAYASWQPQHKDRLELPGDCALRFPSPKTPFRAWFLNDADLHYAFLKRHPEHAELFLETLLRCKANTIEGRILDGGSWKKPYSIGRDTALAQRRGLIFTHHHMVPLGASIKEWPNYWKSIRGQEPPPLDLNAPFEDFWRYHIECALTNRVESLWLLAFRGDSDGPFWGTFKDAPTEPAQRAAVIERMLSRQRKVFDALGLKDQMLRVTLYNELSDLAAAGLLHPPQGKDVIWTFVNARRDHYPPPDLNSVPRPEGQPVGYYFNLQFTSTGSHLADGEGPWKAEANFRAAAARGNLVFSLVNAGNAREHMMPLAAHSRMMLDPEAYDTDRFLGEFCERYYGSDAANRAAQLYRNFYDAYWSQRKPDIPGFARQFIFQDMRVASASRKICQAFGKPWTNEPLRDKDQSANGRTFAINPQDLGSPDQVTALIEGLEPCVKKFRAVYEGCVALAPAVRSEGRAFLMDNLAVQSAFMANAYETLWYLAKAYAAYGRKQDFKPEISQAKRCALAMREALKQAEHGYFEGWYDRELVFGLDKLLEDTNRLEVVPNQIHTP